MKVNMTSNVLDLGKDFVEMVNDLFLDITGREINDEQMQHFANVFIRSIVKDLGSIVTDDDIDITIRDEFEDLINFDDEDDE